MKNVSHEEIARRSVSPGQLSQFLLRRGWVQVRSPNDRLSAFQGPKAEDGELIELTFPNRLEYRDFYPRAAEVMESLAIVLNEDPEEVARQIARINRDVLRARIVSFDSHLNSLSLDAAAEYVKDLRTLMSYAASTEQKPRAYFGKASPIGSEFVEECRFGHTFRGSFGFMVESPLLPEPVAVEGQSQPAPLKTFSRKVMERLAVGFDLARRGVEQQDVTFISGHYGSGLNANMCETAVKMANVSSKTAVEFSVGFGGQFGSRVEFQGALSPLLLNEETTEYLSAAATSLRSKYTLERKTLRGKIVELRSDNGLMDDVTQGDHSVLMYWPAGGVKVRLVLPFQEYLIALDAHRSNRIVTIEGVPEKFGKRWILTEQGSLGMESLGDLPRT